MGPDSHRPASHRAERSVRGVAIVARARSGVIAVLATVVLVAGCSVVPLPNSTAVRGQTPRERDWDVKDCQAEAGYQTGYSPTDSPLANWFQKLFFWSATGAAVGGTIMTVPAAAGVNVSGPTLMSSPTGEAVVAGAGAGAITGTALSWSGQARFERAWVACMESRGYAIVRTEENANRPQSMRP
jgi:hypothetical protein